MTHPTPIIKADGLSRIYGDGDSRHPVLEQASLQIFAGECVALLGQSGSGKSTILNLLGGIDRPDSGEIVVAGKRISTLEEPQLTLFRRDSIGYIYQFFNLIPTLTVYENVDLPVELQGLGPEIRKSRVMARLKQVELASRADAFPDQLSGGEQQRVAIARALVHEPMLLLADEPTGNLDAETGAKVLSLLTGLSRDSGRTLIMVTHSRQIAQAADRILVLENGRIHEGDSALAW